MVRSAVELWERHYIDIALTRSSIELESANNSNFSHQLYVKDFIKPETFLIELHILSCLFYIAAIFEVMVR